jgi:hypothetical protein
MLMTPQASDPCSAIAAAPRGTLFRATFREGRGQGGDPVSFFASRLPDPELSFDVSNNKVLANVGGHGAIRSITIYRGQHGVDDMPGVWMHKELSRSGPLGFGIEADGEAFDLVDGALPHTTALLENVFPVTDYEHPHFHATTLTFAPVSADGSVRLRCAVHGLSVTNRSAADLRLRVRLPWPRRTTEAPFENPDIVVHNAENPQVDVIAFVLRPGESRWVPCLAYAFGDSVLQTFNERGSLWWLQQSLRYMKRMTGRLSMPGDPYAAEFLERSVHQCFHSIGMDARGEVVGSNWGSFPATEKIWNRDWFYSLLPLHLLEPALFRQGMQWFVRHGKRPPGNAYAGGVTHSLTNALSGALMAGLYYGSTGDLDWFRSHPEVVRAICSDLDEAWATRDDAEGALLPSLFLSDGYSLGDRHTGSNVLAWAAFHHAASLLADLGEPSAQRRADAARQIRDDLEMRNTVEGAFGAQYLEGISRSHREHPTLEPVAKYEGRYRDFGLRYVGPLIREGHIDLLHHDGEESDTILMPHFGYCDYEASSYRNYMRFTLSPHNPVYNPESRGLQWGDKAAATFPGYMNGLGQITDAASLSGPHGFLTEIRKLTDVDGSLWWWPYYNGAAHGDVVRHHHCGKCGWASGVFAAMFITEILGLRWHAPDRTLRFRPFSPSSSFQWDDFPLGSQRLSASFRQEEDSCESSLTNHGSEPITVEWCVPCADGHVARSDGIEPPDVRYAMWNGRRVVLFREPLAGGAMRRVITSALVHANQPHSSIVQTETT